MSDSACSATFHRRVRLLLLPPQSADPIHPDDPDKSKCYPALVKKVDSDGLERHFPQKLEVAIFWTDWDRAGTPDDMSDDTIRPINLWRVRKITGDQPLPTVTDDSGDGKLEVNRPAEMLLYTTALKGTDHDGRQVAHNPVLVKGTRVWYEDARSPNGVSWFDYQENEIVAKPFEIFGLDHNVPPLEESWGYDAMDPANGCRDCHRNDTFDSPVLDR